MFWFLFAFMDTNITHKTGPGVGKKRLFSGSIATRSFFHAFHCTSFFWWKASISNYEIKFPYLKYHSLWSTHDLT
ncbi:hypothetical protein D4L85_07450 [Chryseolinea soli]|uniref:Uncharacterized protein n=1 Tax=Chryseolinea soli TaxID=2321403 RepID=A0A385SHL9_9BACT|nr:hypothetical protein D4L85_07450 [Chryseolinea soli]